MNAVKLLKFSALQRN